MRDDMSTAAPESLDPRQRRTRQALAAAILALAKKQAVAEISVSALAREAGVHRSTVYQHAASPAALLAAVLSEELDVARETYLFDVPDGGLGQAVRSTTLGVLEHLEAHEVIYRRELSETMNPLHAMLRTHFAESVRELIETHDLAPPDVQGLPPDFPDMAARWIADASVGAMSVWLGRPRPRNRETYLRAHAALLPDWWPS